MTAVPLHVQFRACARQGGSLGAVLRTAALADGLQHTDTAARTTLVASAPTEVHDLLYMRVRDLVSLPEHCPADMDGFGLRAPDVLVLEAGSSAAQLSALARQGTTVIERFDGSVDDEDGQPIACRVYRSDGSVRVISGEARMLLDPALEHLRSSRKPTNRPPRELLILLGAGHHPVAELRIAEELAPLACTLDRIDFVTGFQSSSAHRRQLGRLLPTARILPGVLRPGALLAQADLAIVAGAAVVREAACLGTPALLLSCSDKDLPHDVAFAAHGSARHLGHHEALYPGLLARHIKALDAAELSLMAARGPALIPGAGFALLLQSVRTTVAVRAAKLTRKVSVAAL
ncbi:MAG: hypothetical protein EXS14_09270 [Planctomycetes bacterium]|nr:hypothetical protein [Planctomycetota bacterium]